MQSAARTKNKDDRLSLRNTATAKINNDGWTPRTQQERGGAPAEILALILLRYSVRVMRRCHSASNVLPQSSVICGQELVGPDAPATVDGIWSWGWHDDGRQDAFLGNSPEFTPLQTPDVRILNIEAASSRTEIGDRPRD